VARYVGVNLLFTTSPSYSPSLTPPDLPHTVNIDSNTYEAIPGVNASRRYITPGLLLQELSELQPTTRFSYDNQDLPLTGQAQRCYDLWLPAQDVPCYPDLDYPAFANLFVFNALNLERTQDDAGRVDYELPNFNYATSNAEESGLPFRGHRYLAASFLAKGAYDQVRKGARQAGVSVVGSHDGWQVDEPGSDAAAAAKLEDATTVDHLGPRSHRLRD
jgi:hypothetical protein